MGKFVTLKFELREYSDDTEEEDGKLLSQVTFDGHLGWQNMSFYGKSPNEQQIRLLAKLGEILNELANEDGD